MLLTIHVGEGKVSMLGCLACHLLITHGILLIGKAVPAVLPLYFRSPCSSFCLHIVRI